MKNSLDGRDLLKEMESLADELDSMEYSLVELKEDLEALLAEFDEYESDGDVDGMKTAHDAIAEREKDIADADDELNEWKDENGEHLLALQELDSQITLRDAFLIHEDDFEDYT